MGTSTREFELSKREMADHLELIFIVLLVLIISPHPVWLAPPPSTTTQLIIPDSPLQDPSVRAKQESFLVHPTADNAPRIRKKRFILGDMLNVANLINVDILGTNIRPTNFILLRVKVSIADSPLSVPATRRMKNGDYWKHVTTRVEDADLLNSPSYQCRAPPCTPSRILHRAKRTIPFDISPFSLLKVSLFGARLQIFPDSPFGANNHPLFDFELKVPRELAFLVPGQG